MENQGAPGTASGGGGGVGGGGGGRNPAKSIMRSCSNLALSIGSFVFGNPTLSTKTRSVIVTNTVQYEEPEIPGDVDSTTTSMMVVAPNGAPLNPQQQQQQLQTTATEVPMEACSYFPERYNRVVATSSPRRSSSYACSHCTKHTPKNTSCKLSHQGQGDIKRIEALPKEDHEDIYHRA